MRILSALLNLFGLGNKSFEPAPIRVRAAEKAPHIEPDTHVYRGGRHNTRSAMVCPGCLTTTKSYGRCANRRRDHFNGRIAHTHPDLLSLDRGTRLRAQARWARGGMAALFAN